MRLPALKIKNLQKITQATLSAEISRDEKFFASKTRENIIKHWTKPIIEPDFPIIHVPENYRIFVTDDARDLRYWIDNEVDWQSGVDAEKHATVGCDSEWLWYSRKTQLADVVQLATKESCLVYQLAHKVRKSGGKYDYCEELHEFLHNERIKKIFLAVDGDWNKLGYRNEQMPDSIVDVDVDGIGAQRLCVKHLGMTLEKDPNVILSRWSRAILDDQQLRYASTDAYANILLYENEQIQRSIELHGGNAIELVKQRAVERAKRQAAKKEEKRRKEKREIL